MVASEGAGDEAAIRRVCETMYDALSWSPQDPPKWDIFKGLFVEGALLGPSARPLSTIDVDTFIGRMSGQRDDGSMAHFTERHLGMQVRSFGVTAVVQSAYLTVINQEREARGVNSMVLTKENGDWKILAMCWDSEREGQLIPDELKD